MVPVAMFVAGISAFSLSAYAGGECAKGTVEHRLTCIEEKVDSANHTLTDLANSVGKKPDQGAIQQMIDNSLTGVKIEWTKHPNRCLYYTDENNAALVETCDHDDFERMTIHK